MNLDFNRIIQPILKLVKLPPLRLVIAILLIINLVQFYERTTREQGIKKDINIVQDKLDSCHLQSSRETKNFAMKIDSVRIETAKKYEDKLIEINNKSEEALKEQREANKIMEKTIINLSKHK